MLESTTAKLNEVVHKQREEMDRLRQENSELNVRLQERTIDLDRSDRRLHDEHSNECDKITKLLEDDMPSNIRRRSGSSCGSAARRSDSSRCIGVIYW